MFVFIGLLVVILSVFGGFVLSGGHLLALFQPFELLMIGGAAVGAFIISNDWRNIKIVLKSIVSVIKPSKYKKNMNVQLLSAFYELLTKIRKEGMLSIEGDIQNPKESPIFSRYPLIVSDKKIMEFIVDHMQLIITGRVDLHQLDEMIDIDIETYENETEIPINAINKIGDSMPAFGIVAAVMGVVHTMESMNQPPAVLGGLVAKALVGTFLGVLLGYGFVSPIAVALENKRNCVVKMLQAIKILLLAAASNTTPSIGVELARKVLYSDIRPNSLELEEILRDIKSAGATSNE